MKILLTGISGQVGWELARTLLPLGEVVAVSRTDADLGNLAALREFIRQTKPDVIVNPAAYTAVDKAESELGLAVKINADAPGVMAEAAKKTGALLIHYSTDYVFDGSKQSPYLESDRTAPLNVYGQSKLAGEEAIRAADGDYLILRTSWVFSSRGNNFVKTMLRLAQEREEMKIVDDQLGAPTWARLIAEVTAHILAQSAKERLNRAFQSDVYHLTASGATSWFGFAQTIIDEAKKLGSLTLKNRAIHPIPTRDYPLPAQRPQNSVMSTQKLERHFGLAMPTWDTTLRLCLQEML